MHWIYAHLIGDFLFQTHEIAIKKKTSSIFCSYHVVCYIVPFLLCGLTSWQLVLIAAQHFVIDRTGFVVWFMKWKGSAGFTEPPMAPWSIIVMDNILHILWIAFVVWLPELFVKISALQMYNVA
jgi:hypothetical protein